MATIRDILGNDTLKFENDFKAQGLNGKELESAMIKLARDTRAQREIPIQNKVNDALKDSIYMEDSTLGSVLRGVTNTGLRWGAGLDYLSEKIGFDLIGDEKSKALNAMSNALDKKKEDISRENLTPERLAELQKLDLENQNATGFVDNLQAGIKTMADTITHPTEWTTQGITETITDPLNALSFGAGSLASKLGRTMLQKTTLGGTGGAIEGASVNAGAEYTIARGQGKTEKEASKIATQSLGAGALAGGTFGAVGGAINGYTPKIKEKLDNIKSKSVDEILDNDLLKDLDEIENQPSEISKTKQSYNFIDISRDKLKNENNSSRETILSALDNADVYNSLDKNQKKKADELIQIKNDFDSYENSLKNSELERDKIFNDIQQNTKRKIPEFKSVYDNLPTEFTLEQINKIDTKLNDFAVQEQFKVESIYPEKKDNYTPNFRFVSDKLPSILKELVDTELIDEPTAKQIEYKNKTILLGHKDIIYAGMEGWKESVNQSIIDAINGNKISKLKKIEDISSQSILKSQELAKTLAAQGADVTTIKDTINNKIIATKEELDFTNILNDGMPVENRFSGARLRTAIQNSISNPIRTPDEFASILKGAGFNDSVTKIATQSYINKTLDSFDEYITTKISKVNDEQIKTITKKIDDEIIITEDNLQEWLKENPIIKNDSPEMTYRNAVDELDNLQNKSPESIINENLVKFIKDRYGDDGVALHKNYSKQVELESQADDLHSTILDIEDEITNLRDEKATIADNPNVSKEDITNYDTEISKLEKEAQKLTNKKQNIDNKIQNIVGDSIQYEKNITAQKYPQFVRNNMISLKELQDNNIAPLTYEDIYREIKKDYTDINNLPDDKKEFMKSISYGGRLEKAKNKVDKNLKRIKESQANKEINIKPEDKNDVQPNPHKGIDLRGLTEQQKEERRLYRIQSEDIKNKIMNYDYELKNGELIKGDTKIIVHENLIEYAEQIQKDKLERVDYETRYTKYDALRGIEKDISYEEGLNAHRGTSFSPEQRAKTEIASYIEDITSTYESLLKLADTPEKIEMLDNEFLRFKDGYLKRKKTILARRSNVVSSMIAGPANFPVRRMQKANNAVDNAMKDFVDYREKAFNSIARKLKGQDERVIRSNDVDAISKLKDKLSKLESNHEMMKKANEVMRDKKLDTTQKYNKLKELGFSDRNIKENIAPYGKFPQFSLANNLQNIKTVKQRIAQLSKEKTIADNGGTKDILYRGARIHENFTDKRIQIFFDEIPNIDVKTELKKRGFKWSPTSKSWQRVLGSNSKYHAESALNNHFEKFENPATKFDEVTANKYLNNEPSTMEKLENSIKNLEEC